MKAAIVTADQVSTVSQTYCQELRYPYYAHGMSQVLSSRGGDFTGITNGIDTKLFDPMTTEGLAAHYNEKRESFRTSWRFKKRWDCPRTAIRRCLQW